MKRELQRYAVTVEPCLTAGPARPYAGQQQQRGCAVDVTRDGIHVHVPAASAAEALALASQHPVAAAVVDTREVTSLVAEIARDLAFVQQCLVDLQQEIDTMASGNVVVPEG